MDRDVRGRFVQPSPSGAYILMNGETPDVVLARIDERLIQLDKTVKGIEDKLNSNYVSREKFEALDGRLKIIERGFWSVVAFLATTVAAYIVKYVHLS